MRMKRFCQFFLSVSLFTSVVSAQAAMQLELTQGMNAAIPIAVMPFANQTNNVPGNTTLSDVISSDLQNSGEFKVKAQQNDVSDVVTGQVRQTGAGSYRVSFQLADAKQSATPLLNETFSVNQGGLRSLAHHISDLIYEKLTGTRGVFNTKIAYVLAQRYSANNARYQLIVADEDGFNPQTLFTSSQPIMSPTWSPNGKNLAYVSFEGHQASIYTQNLASGGRELIARYPGMNNAPAFSPNGQRMAMVLTLSGNPNIYVMDLGTKRLTQITNGYAIDTEPVFSADGSALYFTSNRAGGPQIYRYDFASGQTSRVVFDGSYNARACLTRDGQTLVLMHREGSAFNIAKQNLVSGRLTLLTDSGFDDSPSLAPNGKMVLYGTRSGGRQVLGLVSVDGRVKLRLPSAQGDVQDPSWSPFLA